MEKIGPIYLDKDEAEMLVSVLEFISKEQEKVRNDATKKIASCFSLLNLLQKPESKAD